MFHTDRQGLERAIRAETLAKSGFNPDQPRDEDGRWTAEGASDEQGVQTGRPSSGLTPAQDIIFPDTVVPWMDQILPAKPLPETPPFPGEILPPAVGTPDIAVPRTLENPYPEDAGCAQEWQSAKDYCRDFDEQGKLGQGDYEEHGRTYAQCVRGQVSERCGGNPVNRGPRPFKKPPRRPLI
jgi:hypothetical protein